MHQSALIRLFVAMLMSVALSAIAQEETEGQQRPFDPEALQQLAGRGNSDAQFELGVRYLGGDGMPKDAAKAAEWFQKAADQQHLGAMNAMGTLYQEGLGLSKDEKKAFEWFQKSAKYGFPLAQQNLAECYDNGKGVEKNEAEAFKWLGRSAHQDFAPAQAQYAWKLEHGGQGIEKSTHEAAQWYLRAAQQNFVPAMTHLAYLYYSGVGVPLDYRHAEAWYRRAGRSQDPWAHNDLAWFLSTCPDENFLDADTAVEFAKSAVDKLSENKRYEVLDTLAAALARSGKFGEAVQTELQAIVLFSQDKTKEKESKPEELTKLEKELSDRLGLYRKHTPYADKEMEAEPNTKPLPDDRILQEEMPRHRKDKPQDQEKVTSSGAEIS